MTVRALVCGGRDYADRARLFDVLTHYDNESGGFDVLIHGAARGADSLADEWARAAHLRVLPFPADWGTHGRSAGHIRNAQMIREGKPTVVIAFPGGRGTANMIEQAILAGIPVIVVFT